MTISKDDFRRIMGHFATGVTIVSVKDERGKPFGLTVNSFTSVSLEPLLVLVCIDHSAQSYSLFRKGAYFGVSILTPEQVALSNRFASRQIVDRFENVPYVEGKTGVALLPNSLARLECRIVEAYPGGDHTIFIGAVEDGRCDGGSPLLFFGGRYGELMPEPESPR
jgi:flavin reductase (DIM6/NTAB) family NADH-FMN oxidoreductase RutF